MASEKPHDLLVALLTVLIGTGQNFVTNLDVFDVLATNFSQNFRSRNEALWIVYYPKPSFPVRTLKSN